MTEASESLTVWSYLTLAKHPPNVKSKLQSCLRAETLSEETFQMEAQCLTSFDILLVRAQKGAHKMTCRLTYIM